MQKTEDVARCVLDGIKDGCTHSLDELEKVVASSMNGSGLGTESGRNAEVRRGVDAATSRLKEEGLLSYPRRGSVRITSAGLQEINGGTHACPVTEHPLRGARIVDADQSYMQWVNGSLVYSPPLTQEEIDGIEADASEEHAKIMPGPEAVRMLKSIVEPGGRVGCRAP